MKTHYAILLFALMLCRPLAAQFNVDLDADRGTVWSNFRNDQLWHSQSAHVGDMGTGNVSLLSESRYVFARRWEASTCLAADYFRPSLSVKYLLFNRKDKWFMASTMSTATAFPGLKFAQRQGWEKAVDTTMTVPASCELGYELTLSRAFSGDPNCTHGQQWLIVSASAAVYGGIRFNRDDLPQPQYHFLANRSATLYGNGIVGRFKVWADWLATSWMAVHGGMFFYLGSFENHFAGELHAEAEMFLSRRWSFKAGARASVANYNTTDSHFGIVPLADITYYFGQRRNEKFSLFNPNGRLY